MVGTRLPPDVVDRGSRRFLVDRLWGFCAARPSLANVHSGSNGDIGRRPVHVWFGPQERTSTDRSGMSVLCLGRTSCPRLGPLSSRKEKWNYSIGIISERRGIPSAWDRWPLLCMSSTK
jgi:hypothetical protein